MLKRMGGVGALAALVALAGCTAGRAPAPNYPTGGYGGGNYGGGEATASTGAPRSTASQPSDDSGGSDEANEAPPTSTDGCCAGPATRSTPAPEPARRERPGLGTVFGESRRSEVRQVSFQRASDQPFALLDARYNDAAGTRAMIERLLGRGAQPQRAPTLVTTGVDVSVVNEYGQPLAAYFIGGHMQVVGENNQRYAIRVTNRSGQRYEIVASVDGLDVLDGKRAELGKRGYVLDGYATLMIEGFRTSFSEVAAFRFGSVANSYAGRTGEARNVGVIAVALFAEYQAPQYDQDDLDLRESAEPFAKPPPGWVAE